VKTAILSYEYCLNIFVKTISSILNSCVDIVYRICGIFGPPVTLLL